MYSLGLPPLAFANFSLNLSFSMCLATCYFLRQILAEIGNGSAYLPERCSRLVLFSRPAETASRLALGDDHVSRSRPLVGMAFLIARHCEARESGAGRGRIGLKRGRRCNGRVALLENLSKDGGGDFTILIYIVTFSWLVDNW